jgi:hypothetical protein
MYASIYPSPLSAPPVQPSNIGVPASFTSILDPDFLMLMKLSGVVAIEIAYDCSGGIVFTEPPEFIDADGERDTNKTSDVIAVVEEAAEKHLDEFTRNWGAEGGEGTLRLFLKPTRVVFENDGRERLLLYRAHFARGCLAEW